MFEWAIPVIEPVPVSARAGVAAAVARPMSAAPESGLLHPKTKKTAAKIDLAGVLIR
jgi:hypothetical protein